MTKTLHIRPHAAVAERVLLPGDPGRALRLAQLLVEAPRMLNHNRGLWGYTGAAADGRLLTIQSTGLGGPSAAIVVEELARLGARRMIRVGTCGALVDDLAPGALIAVERALSDDGASRALGAGAAAMADPQLTGALAQAAARTGTAASTDLFYDADPERLERWRAEGALACDLQSAAVLAAAARRGLAAGCLLAVAEVLVDGPRRRLEGDELEAAEAALGRAAYAALA